jgi:hypothetical protein
VGNLNRCGAGEVSGRQRCIKLKWVGWNSWRSRCRRDRSRGRNVLGWKRGLHIVAIHPLDSGAGQEGALRIGNDEGIHREEGLGAQWEEGKGRAAGSGRIRRYRHEGGSR